MTRSGLAAFVLLLVAIGPATAQQDVTRRQYTFLDNNLTIEVVSEQAGTLRILRGEAGLVEVVGHAPSGIVASALGGRQEDQLRLSAVGAQSAEYLVIVPEGVRVRIRLPNSENVEIAPTRPSSTYRWSRADSNDSPDAPELPALGPLNTTQDNDLILSHFSRAVPRSFSVPDLSNFSRLDVRFAGEDFRLSTSRAVTVSAGRSDRIEFRAVNPGLEAVISLPADTRDFQLVLAGKVALEVVGGEIRSHCDLDAQRGLGTRVYSYVSASDLICR